MKNLKLSIMRITSFLYQWYSKAFNLIFNKLFQIFDSIIIESEFPEKDFYMTLEEDMT